MTLTSFSFPTPTLFGAGALSQLPARLKGLGIRRPLVVTDAGLLGTDAFRTLANTLGAAEQGKSWFVYSGVHPNPVEQDVREAAQAFCEHGCDGVIAIGGGSPLDAARRRGCWSSGQGSTWGSFMMSPIGRGWRRWWRFPRRLAPGAKWGGVQ